MRHAKKFRLVAGCILMLLAGCAGIPNEEAFKTTVSAWKGHNVNELVQSWGPPNSTFGEPDGTVIYTYYEGALVPTACTVDFVVDHAQKIVGWRFAGTACRTVY